MAKHASSFRRKTNSISTLQPPEVQHQQNINHFPSPGWELNTSRKERIATTVRGITGRADDIDLKRRCSFTIIGLYQADCIIYTNGSVGGGKRNRGAAEVATGEFPIQPKVVTIIKSKGRTFTNSYKEEAAKESALFWTSTSANHPSITVLFCRDTKSLCQALILSNPCTSSIHNSINSILSSIFI